MKQTIKRALMTAGLALSLAACSSFTHKQNLAATCASASAAIKTLTVAKQEGKISESADLDIKVAIRKVKYVCGAPEAPTAEDVKWLAFDEAVAILRDKVGEL